MCTESATQTASGKLGSIWELPVIGDPMISIGEKVATMERVTLVRERRTPGLRRKSSRSNAPMMRREYTVKVCKDLPRSLARY